MKIAFILNSTNFGGGEEVIQALSTEFMLAGNSVFWISWNKELDCSCKPAKSIIPKILITKHSPERLIGKIKCILEIRRFLLSYKIDTLVLFNSTLAEYGILSALFTKVATLISERVDPYFLPESKLHRIIRPVIYSFATGLIFQTSNSRDFFCHKIRNNSVVIPNFLMAKNLPDIQHIYHYRKEIVAAGRLSIEKNFAMLIDVFSMLPVEYNDYKLIIYGEGELHAMLNGLIERRNLVGRIVLYGKVTNLSDYLKGADIFILSSIHEGMPNALIEAMAMGLACISTNVNSGGTSSLIRDFENGLLVHVNDPDALYHALLFLLENPNEKERIKQNAIMIRETNDKQILSERWLDFIRINAKKAQSE